MLVYFGAQELLVPFNFKRKVAAPLPPWKPVSDRRHEPRDHALAEQPLSARLMGGVDVKLRNISQRGVLFESPVRMQVRGKVTLRLRTTSDSLVLPGEVVRCRVSATKHGRLRYETALALSTE